MRWPWQHRHKRKNIAAVPQQLKGIQLSSAAAGLAIPIVYGQARCPGNLVHVKPRDTTIPGGSSLADLVDTLPIAMALCEGPIRGLGGAWADKEALDATAVAAAFASGVYFVLFLGTSSQTPWAYLTSVYPAEAIPYQLTAYIVNRYWPSVKGAAGGSFANWAWEVLGLLPQGGGILDSNPKDVINDFLTEANHGALFPSSLIDSSWLTQFATYCQAAGIFISPVVQTQRPAAEHLQEWLAAANSAFVWSDGKLKIVPYGDQAITGNGTTYTPNVTPLYNLTDDDFIAGEGEDPVRLSRRPQSDVYNMVQVEFDNRTKGYNGDLAEAKDQASIEIYQLKPAPVIKAPFVKDMAVARLVAQLALQRQVYIRNSYEFRLGFRYVLLEPMDLVTLTDANLGLVQTTVRLTEVSEEEDGSFTCTAEEWPFGVATSAAYGTPSGVGYLPNVPKAPDAPSPSVSFDATGQAILNIVGDASTVKHKYTVRTDHLPTLAETRAGSTSAFQSPAGIATGVVVTAGSVVYVGALAYNVNGVESALVSVPFRREGSGVSAAPQAYITPLNGETDDLIWNERFNAIAGSGGGGANLTWAIFQKIGFATETTLFSGNATTLPKDAAIARHPRSDKDIRYRVTDTATGLFDEVHLVLPAARLELNDTGNPYRAQALDDGGYNGRAVDPGGSQLHSGVLQLSGGSGKNLAVGRYAISTGTHGQSVSFPNNYQNPPAVNILGGISYEPASVWSTNPASLPGALAPAAARQIDEVVAYNVTTSGCSLRARLRQASASTNRSDAYAAGAITTNGGTKEATTTNAPANDDSYTTDFTYNFHNSGLPGKTGSISATVCLDYWDGSVWTQVASATYSDTDSDGDGDVLISGSDSLTAVVTGLTGSSKFRIRLVVNANSGGGTRTYSVDPGNVSYTTTSGDQYASKTPGSLGIGLSVEVIGAS